MDRVTLYVLAVLFGATLVQSAFGFGMALIAMPLLAFQVRLEIAAPLVVLVSICVSAFIMVQDWRKVHFASVGWLLFATLLGIPLGLMLLTSSHQRMVKIVLGGLIIAFAGCSLARKLPELKSDGKGWLLCFGFVAGIFGGAFAMNGPPLVMYGSMRRWSPQHFRATLQGYFLPASLVGMAAYGLDGLWVWNVTRYFLLALPATLFATWIGRFVNHRLHVKLFQRYVYAGLVVLGSVLVFQAVAR